MNSSDIIYLISSYLNDTEIIAIKNVNKLFYISVKRTGIVYNIIYLYTFDAFKFYISSVNYIPNNRLINKMITGIISLGGLDKLKVFTQKYGYTYFNDTHCEMAAKYGQLYCLKYLHEHNVPWNRYTCESAAFNGYIQCLKYAHRNGCELGDSCSKAADGGSLSCLKYAHKNGGFWDSYTCQVAATFGNLDCLKYTHENGCPWDSETCYAAAEYEQLDCLKYAHKHGCPIVIDTLHDAVGVCKDYLHNIFTF